MIEYMSQISLSPEPAGNNRKGAIMTWIAPQYLTGTHFKIKPDFL